MPDAIVLASTTSQEGCAVTVPLGLEFQVGAVRRSTSMCHMSVHVSRWESDWKGEETSCARCGMTSMFWIQSQVWEEGTEFFIIMGMYRRRNCRHSGSGSLYS